MSKWKEIEKWGKSHPVILVVVALLIGMSPGGIGGYNLGVSVGTSKTDERWRAIFATDLKTAVNEQLATKCGEAVGKVTNSCQRAFKRYDATIAEKDKEIAQWHANYNSIQNRLEILDLHVALTRSARGILQLLRAAHEKGDTRAEAEIRVRLFSFLLDVHRLNEIYTAWAGLFDDKATELVQRYEKKEIIPTEELIAYLNEFTADADRKRKVMQNEANEANKIRNKKY